MAFLAHPRPEDMSYSQCVRLELDELLHDHFNKFVDTLDQRFVRQDRVTEDVGKEQGNRFRQSLTNLKSIHADVPPRASPSTRKEEESPHRASASSGEVRKEGLKSTSIKHTYSRRVPTPWGQRHFPVLSRFVLSADFEVLVGLVIIANCLILGLEAEIRLGRAEDFTTVVKISENVITAIFVAEIMLRIFISGFGVYAPVVGNMMNFFDACLVLVTGVVVVWIMPLLQIESHDSLRALNVLRAFRLARLVRVLANFDFFHEVWLLLCGLLECGRVLFSTVVVIFLITYIFAIFGVTLISMQIKDEYASLVDPVLRASSDLNELADVTAGVLPLMNLLIQVLTLDSWNGIARPMMKYIPWCWLYFYLYIAIAVIVMMNLVTAVIVDNALTNSQKDANLKLKLKEKETRAKLAHFRQVFMEMDVDGDGELSWSEFEAAFEDEELSNDLRLLGIELEGCRDMFNLLAGGDAVLTIEEFFDGLQHMEGGAQAINLFKANAQIEFIAKLCSQQFRELREDFDEILYVTLGARVRERKISLKGKADRRVNRERSRSGNGSESLSKYTADRRGSLDSAVSETLSRQTSQKGSHEEFTLGDIVGRLDQIIGSLNSKMDFKCSIERCAHSIAVDSDHSGVPEERTQVVTPKSQQEKEGPTCPGLPPCAGEFESYAVMPRPSRDIMSI